MTTVRTTSSIRRTSAPTRRDFLGMTAAAGAAITLGAAGYAQLAGVATGRMLTSQGPLPRPFTVPLPIPPVLRPVSTARGTDYYELDQREGHIEILPGRTTTVWGYDGIFPGPTFTARSGRRTVVRVSNNLTVPTAMHLHGGVTPADSDGYPTDLVLPERCAPGQPRPSAQKGHRMPLHAEGKTTFAYRTYAYPLHQQAATLWYHDHRMDFTGPQVWRGLAGMFLVRDDEEDRLPLPTGDREIPLMLCDRAFTESGAFRYPALDPSCTGRPGVQTPYMNGVLGDVQLVNGAPWPHLEVSNTRYRLRLLNAANARRYHLRLETDDGRPAPVTQIGSDGGLLAAPQRRDSIPMAPAERFDVIVDFARHPVGSHLTLVNTAARGRMRDIMRFHIVRTAKDDTRIPTRLTRFGKLIPTAQMPVRRFDFRRTQQDGEHPMWTINGRPFTTSEVLATPRLNTVERWRFSSDFHHHVHLHLAQFQVIARGNKPPDPSDAGWKDTVDVRPYETVETLVRFTGYRGRYMLHCHNLEHEDMAMMATFHVV